MNEFDAQRPLVPVEQKQVRFYEDKVTAVRLENGTILVPVRPICEQLGVTWQGQRERIKRDPVLSNVTMSVSVTLSDIDPSSRQPKTSAMTCLPLQYLNGWLFGIAASRVKEGIRGRLIRYQRDCYQVLYEAMQDGRLTINPNFEFSDDVVANAQEAYRLATAVARLAHNQLVLEATQRRNLAQLADHAQRIEALETVVTAPGRVVSQAQAMEISQAVKAVAMILSKQTRTNAYGGVYGEVYRRYSITSYRQLPLSKFEDCLGWLNEWRETLASDGF